MRLETTFLHMMTFQINTLDSDSSDKDYNPNIDPSNLESSDSDNPDPPSNPPIHQAQTKHLQGDIHDLTS
jgi:hypothetical protein